MSMQQLRNHPRIEDRGALSEPVIYDRALKGRMSDLLAELGAGSEVSESRLASFRALQAEDLKTWGRVRGYFELERGYYSDRFN
jgi:hypothetical protein